MKEEPEETLFYLLALNILGKIFTFMNAER